VAARAREVAAHPGRIEMDAEGLGYAER